MPLPTTMSDSSIGETIAVLTSPTMAGWKNELAPVLGVPDAGRAHVIPDAAAGVVEGAPTTGEPGRFVELNEFLLDPLGQVLRFGSREVQNHLIAVDVIDIAEVADAAAIEDALVDDKGRQFAFGRIDDEVLDLAHAVSVARDDLVSDRHLVASRSSGSPLCCPTVDDIGALSPYRPIRLRNRFSAASQLCAATAPWFVRNIRVILSRPARWYSHMRGANPMLTRMASSTPRRTVAAHSDDTIPIQTQTVPPPAPQERCRGNAALGNRLSADRGRGAFSDRADHRHAGEPVWHEEQPLATV